MPIILTKPFAINKKKQAELKEIGYIVIETDNPNEIFLDETPSLDGNILLSAALEALENGNDNASRLAFGNLIRKKIKEKNK